MMTEDCLLWEGARYPSGYGRLYDVTKKERVYAHRAVYEAQYGPIPEGMEVHHECGCKACVNPHHLELKSKGDHTKHHMTKEFCKRGHLLADTRRTFPDGTSACIECRKITERNRAPRGEGRREYQRAYQREYYLRKKGQVP